MSQANSSVSEVSICNQALGLLGEGPITSFTDNVETASLCLHGYAGLRDAVLESYEWSFAIRRDNLDLLNEDPIGYGSAYQVPSDVLRVIKVSRTGDFNSEEPDFMWEMEDGKILTDEGAIYTRSIIRITDPQKYSANFVQAFVARLAMEFAIPITNSRTLQEQMTKLYVGKISEAFTTDGMQGRNKRIRSTWLLRRR